MPVICQKEIPFRPWAEDHLRRLPGLNPVAPGEWLVTDDVYAEQMAYRLELLAAKGAAVLRMDEPAREAAEELLEAVLDEIAAKPGFRIVEGGVACPDGRTAGIDRARPLETCGALVQDDLCLMQKRGDEHILTAALLCFPASWSLEQKFMRPLTTIHDPVARYDGDVARRVQRLFDLIRPEAPMWRANFLVYSDPDLHQPRRMEERRKVDPAGPKWLRMERQALRRLPRTGAVVFSIHTYVLPFSALSEADRAALA
jgi:hypothetical protein